MGFEVVAQGFEKVQSVEDDAAALKLFCLSSRMGGCTSKGANGRHKARWKFRADKPRLVAHLPDMSHTPYGTNFHLSTVIDIVFARASTSEDTID